MRAFAESDKSSRMFLRRAWDAVLPAAEDHPSWRRIVLRNTGSTTVDDIEVKVEALAPEGVSFLPVRLQRMHHDPHPFSLHPGEFALLDVAAFDKGEGKLWLCYDESLKLPGVVPPRSYVLTLSARGRDVAKNERRVHLEFPAADSLVLRVE